MPPFSNAPDCTLLFVDSSKPGIMFAEFSAVWEDMWHQNSGFGERGCRMPIIFITGHGDIPMTVRAMKRGAVDFLTKPFNDQQLLDAINVAIDNDRGARVEMSEVDVLMQRVDRLTPRERQVMALVITGMLNKQIAYQLGISEKTVKVHRGHVMEKLEIDSVAELVRLAQKVGVEPGDIGE